MSSYLQSNQSKQTRIRTSNISSIALRLAKIHAIESLRIGMTNCKATGFTTLEIRSLVNEFLRESYRGGEND
jgi:hypothetical protein